MNRPKVILTCLFLFFTVAANSIGSTASAQYEHAPSPDGDGLPIAEANSDPPPWVEFMPPDEGGIVAPDIPVDSVTGAPTFWQEGNVIMGPPPVTSTWYNPFGWMGPKWDGSFEIGINGAQGNADAFSLSTGFELSRETAQTNWDIDFAYAKNMARGVETQHNALLTSDFDYELSIPQWSLFSQLGLEYDEFKNFDLRLFLNTGIGYLLIDTEQTQFKVRAGSGASREFGGTDEFWVAEAVLGVDITHQISERQKFSAVVDYYPSWEEASDYRLITNISWEVVLDQASNLSLKVGVLDRYDSTPNGAKPNDVNYSLLLLWSL